MSQKIKIGTREIQVNQIDFIDYKNPTNSYLDDYSLNKLYREIFEAGIEAGTFESFKKCINWGLDSRTKEKHGSIQKRIIKYMYDALKIRFKDLSDKQQTKIDKTISNIMATQQLPERPYYYDITDRLDWPSGTFGDMGSCFLNATGKTNYSTFITRCPEYYVLRIFNHVPEEQVDIFPRVFYKADDGSAFTGTSRCLIWKPSRYSDAILIHNAYGYTLNQFAMLAPQIFGVNLSIKAHMANHPSSVTSGIYLNNLTGFVITDNGKHDIFATPDQLRKCLISKRCDRVVLCETGLGKNSGYWVEEKRKPMPATTILQQSRNPFENWLNDYTQIVSMPTTDYQVRGNPVAAITAF